MVETGEPAGQFTMRTFHAGYRPDVDGLRAVAVLTVVLFHAFPGWFAGGFIGVDVFFVISGFLISGIIFRSANQNRFSYRDFYSRRIRRIFPSLAVVLLSSFVAGFVCLFSTELARLERHIAAAAGFAANFVFWRETGYFGVDSGSTPMLHLWSLGVEEQFYLLWPLVVIGLLLRTRRFGFVIVTTFTLSFLANLALTWKQPASAFYLPISRFWELMLGAGLAYKGFEFPQRRRNLTSAVGLIAVLGSAALLNSQSAFPGWWALLPTFGSGLIIASGPDAWLNRRLLSMRPMVFLGLISYPLYLWHWPLLSFAHIEFGSSSHLLRASAVVTAFVLAYLTYFCVEKPLRFGSYPRKKTAGLVIAVAVIGLCALFVRKPVTLRDLYVAYFDNERPTYHYGHSHNLFVLGREECNFLDIETNTARERIADSCTKATSPTKVLLWGDSHIQHLAGALKDALPAGISLLQVATSGCHPNTEPFAGESLSCERSNRFATEAIARINPDLVVLAQRDGHMQTDWGRLAAKIHELGARQVLLIGPVPKWDRPLYSIIARQHWPNPPDFLSDGLMEQDRLIDQQLQQRFAHDDVLSYVSIFSQLCKPDSCRVFVGPDRYEDIVSQDDSHFTISAAHYVAGRIVSPKIEQLLGSQTRSLSTFNPRPGRVIRSRDTAVLPF